MTIHRERFMSDVERKFADSIVENLSADQIDKLCAEVNRYSEPSEYGDNFWDRDMMPEDKIVANYLECLTYARENGHRGIEAARVAAETMVY